MSIASIVTRGFGVFGAVDEIPSRGFSLPAEIVVVSTGGASYLTREEYEAELARHRTLDNARKRAQRKYKARIRDAVIAALNPHPEREPQIEPVAAVVPPPAPMAPQLAPPPPDARLAAVNTEIRRIRAKLAAYEAEQAEDDDIETLLMLIH